MLDYRDMRPYWLLDCEPRKVQLEAIRRSFFGHKMWENEDDENDRPEPLEGYDGDAHYSWSHFMEMRLGKTPTQLNEFMLCRQMYGGTKYIQLSPNKFKYAWAEEAEKFGIPIPVIVFESGQREAIRKKISKMSEFMLVVNYESLVSPKTVEFLCDIADEKTLISADESIKLKNNKSLTFKNSIAIAKDCGMRRCLSGKPVTQGPHTLWGQLRFTGLLQDVNYYAFRSRYCQMGGWQGKVVVGTNNEEELTNSLRKVSFLARRHDWLKGPGAEWMTREVEMLPEQKAIYDQMERDMYAEIEDSSTTAQLAVTRLIKLQQITSGFLIDDDGVARQIIPVEKVPKVAEVKTMLEEEIEHKVIVIAHYTHTINILREALKEYNPAVINSATQDVEAEKRRFNNDPNCRVIIGQEVATKYGHTLMGDADNPCLHVVFYENTYSLDDRSQCEQRPQGQGQQGPITIIDFFCSPKDKKNVEALQRKEDVAALILGYDRQTGMMPRAVE